MIFVLPLYFLRRLSNISKDASIVTVISVVNLVLKAGEQLVKLPLSVTFRTWNVGYNSWYFNISKCIGYLSISV